MGCRLLADFQKVKLNPASFRFLIFEMRILSFTSLGQHDDQMRFFYKVLGCCPSPAPPRSSVCTPWR